MASMKPKRIAGPKPVVRRDYKVRFGTPNELGPERQFATEALARAAIVKELNSWKPWCTRYNNAGLNEIKAATASIPVFHHDPDRIVCNLDEHTGTIFVAEFWTTR